MAYLRTSGMKSLPPHGHIVQTKYIISSTRVSATHTTWTEPSSSYRVSITPKYGTSRIIVSYQLCFNQNSAANILHLLRAFRIIAGGSKEYNLESRGDSNGTRHQVAGGTFRPSNGTDGNDQNMEFLYVMDHPNTNLAVVYGFEDYPQGTNTTTWGYSGVDNSTWGYDTDIVITATEVKQARGVSAG